MNPLQDKLKNNTIILASASPRRQFLLGELNIGFQIKIPNMEEVFPENLVREAIPLYLAELKSDFVASELLENEIILTADTIVWLENSVLNKPENMQDAHRMLSLLSGKKHEVITAVVLRSLHKKKVFHVVTEVYFKSLQPEEIQYYLDQYMPLDKAGAYGVQEWIGYIGVEKINGSYFNVMGLPVKELYEELMNF